MTLWSGDADLVLASGSAARAGLLANAGLRFDIVPARVDEAAIKHAARAARMSADATALRLADAKAAEVTAARPDALVIGADQLLVCESRWFDKPHDIDAAHRQLLELRGRTHTLVTACACHRGSAVLWHHVETPRLTMRRFSDTFLDAYLRLEANHVTTTVGAYRLEGPGIHLFDFIQGDHSAILGLPILPLLAFLRRMGVLAA